MIAHKKATLKNEKKDEPFFSMDDTLVVLFGELCKRLEECQAKNPGVDVEDITRVGIMIQSYLDGFKREPILTTRVPERELLPDMSYEEITNYTRAPRVTPKGQLGPTKEMVEYAIRIEKENARRVDRVIRLGKEMDANKDKPYF